MALYRSSVEGLGTDAAAVVGVETDDTNGVVVIVGVETSLLSERTPPGGAEKANGDGQACSNGECRSLEEPKFPPLGPCK